MSLEHQAAALAAMSQLATEYPHLPAAVFNLDESTPPRLNVSLHRSFADFEQWREALRADIASVERNELMGSSVHLRAVAHFAGHAVVINGHGPLVLGAKQVAA